MKENFKKILGLVSKNLSHLNEREVKELTLQIKKSKRIFIVGAGRSGLVGRAFGMRLMHLGFEVFIVGDTINPSIKKEDLLLAVSGSGETSFVVSCAKAAKRNKARVLSICGNRESSLGQFSDFFLKIPTNIRKKGFKEKDYTTRELLGEDAKNYAPLGTLFELSTMVFLDGVIALLVKEGKVSEEEMKKRHANLE